MNVERLLMTLLTNTLVRLMIDHATLVVISLVIAWLFVWRGRSLIGYLVGLIPILGNWIAAEWQMISDCMRCDAPLCCEWTGIGVVVYTILALMATALYSALVLGMVFLKKRLSSTPR